MLETRHLLYFKTVAEHLNFTRAAESLSMSQPPLSKQIKQLEAYLGVKLFHRTNRIVKLTEAGKYFYEVTVRTFNNMDSYLDTVRKIDKGEIGNLRIGFGGSVVYDILPKIIQHIHSSYPDLKLNVMQLTTAQQIKALNNGEIDIGFLVPPVDDSTIDIMSIRKEEFIACLHKDHPLAKQTEPLNIASFRDDNIIMTPYSTGIGYYQSVITLCKTGGFFPNIIQTAQEQQTIVSFVASGIGIAFVPLSTSKINHEHVVYRKLSEKIYKETAAAWNKDDNTAAVHLFLSTVKEEKFYAPEND